MKILKRLLKFVIEWSLIALVAYSTFQAGNFIKAKKDNNNNNNKVEQQITSEQNNKEENKQQETNNKLSKEQLDNEFKNILNKYRSTGSEIGFVYKNFATNYRYAENDATFFTAASTTKVIFAMHIYDRIRNGELDNDTEVEYFPNLLQDGGGEITNQPKKDFYPLDYVLKNMIQYSDNTATMMLMHNETNAMNVKVNYLAKLGATYPAKQSLENKISPALMELAWTNLYNHRDDYKQLLTYLQDSKDNEWIKNGINNKTVASKYGGYDTFAHDTALVFGNNKDYLLLIYTNNLRNSAEAIENIARDVNSLTDKNM